jgi:hypothetical protein
MSRRLHLDATPYLVATAARAKEELVSFDKGMAAFIDALVFPLHSLSKDANR